MTKHFQHEIERLKKQILGLSTLVEKSVFNAIHAVLHYDLELARSVSANDKAIDRQEVEIEEECLKVLALHQPVAIDLRFIVAVLKMNNDLERIGDLAVNIAHRAETLCKLERVHTTLDFAGMAEKVKLMLRHSLDSLVNMDLELAKSVLASDDNVDLLNTTMHKDIQLMLRNDVDHLENYILWISVSRNLERIADHATNIAEDVIYMIQGDIVRHGKRF